MENLIRMAFFQELGLSRIIEDYRGSVGICWDLRGLVAEVEQFGVRSWPGVLIESVRGRSRGVRRPGLQPVERRVPPRGAISAAPFDLVNIDHEGIGTWIEGKMLCLRGLGGLYGDKIFKKRGWEGRD